MTITKADTAKVLAYIKNVRGNLEVTDDMVAVWHDLFTDARVGHANILFAAVRHNCQQEDARYGVVPGQIIATYKTITRRIMDRTDGWEELTFEQRQAILADPVELAYDQGQIGTVAYNEQRQKALTAGGTGRFELEARRRGHDFDQIGRMHDQGGK